MLRIKGRLLSVWRIASCSDVNDDGDIVKVDICSVKANKYIRANSVAFLP